MSTLKTISLAIFLFLLFMAPSLFASPMINHYWNDFSEGMGNALTIHDPSNLYSFDDLNGTIHISKPADTTGDFFRAAKVSTQVPISGDFDIRVDFQLIEPLQEGGQLELQAYGESFYFFVVRSNESGLGGQNVHVYYGDSENEGRIAPNPCIAFSQMSGTLRITREGEALTGYVKSENMNDFQHIFSSNFSESDVDFQLAIQSQPVCHSAQSVQLDNLRIMSRNIFILENQTRPYFISDGIQPYTIVSTNSTIADISLDGNIADISGIQPGFTSLTIKDASQQMNQVSIQVLHPGRISGTLRDDKNQPVSNISVELKSVNRADAMFTQTNGFYEFDGLYPGIVELAFLPQADKGFLPISRMVHLHEGEQLNIDDIILSEGVLVTGCLKKPDSTPFSQATLYIQGLGKYYSTHTSENGDFMICLPEGEWYLSLSLMDSYGLFPITINVHSQDIISLGDITTYAYSEENRISGRVFGSNITPWDYLQVVAFPSNINITPDNIAHVSPFAVGNLNLDSNYELFTPSGQSVQLFLVSSIEEPGVESSVTIIGHHPDVFSPKSNNSFDYNVKGFTVKTKVLWHNKPVDNCHAVLMNTQSNNMIAFAETDKHGNLLFYHVPPSSDYEILVENENYSGQTTTFSVVEDTDAPHVSVLSKARNYLYDDFSDQQFDLNRWILPETGHSIENNQANLVLNTNVGSEIRLVIPGSYPYISTLVQISNESHATDNATALAIVGGRFYNDTQSPETASENLTIEGNIRAEVQFFINAYTHLQARAVIIRESNSNEQSEIASFPLSNYINYDQPYEVSILHSEDELIFQIKELYSQLMYSYRYPIETSVFPPVDAFLYLANQIRVESSSGQGNMHSIFDDVYLADIPYKVEYISGTIFGPDNTVISNIHGQIYGDTCWNNHIADFQSGENGQYMVPVPPGSYFLVLNATPQSEPAYVQQWWNVNGPVFECNGASPIDVHPDNPVQDINFNLITGVVVTGQVTAINGKPLSNVCIHAKNDACDGPPIGNASTYDNGTYEMIIPSGDYYIQANTGCSSINYIYMDQFWNHSKSCHEAKLLQVTNEQRIENINFSLELGYEVHGRVLDATHKPIEQLRIGIWHEQAGQWRETQTDEQGLFTLSGIPEGIGFINVEPDLENRRAGYQNRIIISGPRGIELPDIIIQDGYIVTGKLIRPDHTPVSNIELECFDGQQYIELETDTDGNFSQIISNGNWTIILDEDDSDVSLIPVTFTIHDDDINLADIFVFVHSTENRLSGTVDVSFQPEGNLEVVVFQSSTDFSPENFHLVHPLNFSELDDFGAFQVHAPNDIESMVVLISMIDDDASDVETGTILNLIDGLYSPQSDILLQSNEEGQTLSGCIVPYNDTVKGNETILLYRLENDSIFFAGFSDMPSDGCFQLFNIPPGLYQLVVNLPDYQLSEQTNIFEMPLSHSLPPILVYGKEMVPGDMNGNGILDLADVLIGLQVAANMNVHQAVFLKADINKDNAIGIHESIFVLKRIAQ